MQEVITTFILLNATIISSFIPHKSKTYNLSWWTIWLIIITISYIIYCIITSILFTIGIIYSSIFIK